MATVVTGSIAQTDLFVPPPPRLSGNAQQDVIALSQWFQQFYNSQGLANYDVAGKFAIAGTDVNCLVPFASNRQQPNANYYVVFGVESFVGSPPLSALQITNVNKTKEGFTATVNSAPGAGNSVTISYSVRR